MRSFAFVVVVLSSGLCARGSAQLPFCEGAAAGAVPQLADADATFEGSVAATVDRFDGVLVCRTSVADDAMDGRSRHGPVRHAFGRPDLSLQIALPGRREPVRFRGAEDSRAATFSIPGVALARGERIRVVVRDRDVLVEDLIARLDLVFEGNTVLRAQDAAVSIECRGVHADALAGRAASAYGAAVDALVALDAVDPDFTREGAAVPSVQLGRAEASVCAFAALVGSGNAQLASLRGTLELQSRSLAARIERALVRVESVATDLAAELGAIGVRLRVVRYGCGRADLVRLVPDARAPASEICFVRFDLTSDAPTEPGLLVDVLSRDGDPVAAEATVEFVHDRPRRLRRFRLGPRETSVAIVVPTREARYLRVRVGGTAAFVRLGPPSEG